MNQNIVEKVSKELKIKPTIIEATLQLLEEGNTVHFLARYRKEQIGNIDEEIIREIEKEYLYEKQLSERKIVVLERIDEQGMLTDALKASILKASKLVELEQLYEPYKSKRVTKAKKAIDGGLSPLADRFFAFDGTSVMQLAPEYLNEHFGSIDEVLENLGYLLAQQISENVELRKTIKQYHYRAGKYETKLRRGGAANDEEKVYEQYYEFSQNVSKVKHHQILAVARAEKEKVVNSKFVVDEANIADYVYRQLVGKNNCQDKEYLYDVIKDALTRLLLPSIHREIKSEMLQEAHDDAITLFGNNVYQLLMQQPLEKQIILGFDPAFRTGCKLAVLSENGNLEEISIIYPHAPLNKVDDAKRILDTLYKKHQFSIVAIGNGTASRESEQFVGNWIRENNYPIAYTIVSEIGASVYSASKEAIKEFPKLSVEQRSAISIARRVLDPLSELIKINPESLGVGQYQHDLPQKKLSDELEFTVDKAVNKVGVDINSSSSKLLKSVSGISASIAQNIIDYREEKGGIASRSEIKKIKGLGPKAFEQSAGFLRVLDGKNTLDNTSIHPESYAVTKIILKDLNATALEIGTEPLIEAIENAHLEAVQYDIDTFTFESIMNELKNPRRDAREDYPAPMLRQDVLSLEDLEIGLELEGVVRNLTNFGVFIDIGLENDGFAHISKLSKRFIKHPSDVLSIGDLTKVYIENIDMERNRVELSLLDHN